MSLVLADRVRETTTSTGTGTITLGGAVQGFQRFSVLGEGNTTYYTIQGTIQWEVGIGTYSANTLTRDTVLDSSSAGALVDFSGGSKDVFVTLPAEKAITSIASADGSVTVTQVGSEVNVAISSTGGAVTSVAGRTGAVVLSNTDINGLGTIATQNANAVAITGGTATLTSLATATVQATNSAGLSLKNSAGTTQVNMGAGGGNNLSLNVSTNINGANAQVDISPTGTGHVHIKPTGSGSIEIAPTNAGTLDNLVIGGVTPQAITGTALNSTSFKLTGTGASPYTPFAQTFSSAYTDFNGYQLNYIQNDNNGSSASVDYVAYNDASDVNSYFIDMGISSSNYSDATYTVFPANGAYVYTGGGISGQAAPLLFGTSNTASDIIFFTGGTLEANRRARIKGTGNFLIGTDTDNGELLQVNGSANIAGTTNIGGAATFGSTVTLSANPSLALEAATKSYVDNQVTAGIHIHEPVRVETTANLTATYAQGGTTFNITTITGTNTVTTSASHGLAVNDQIWLTTTAGNGLSTNTAYFVYSIPAVNQLTLTLTYGGAQITGLTNATGLTYATRANSGGGATLTNAGTQVALTLDGVALSTTNRVMVRLQTNGAENGVYTVTTVGSGSTNWVLTRAADANMVNPANPNGVGTGDYFFTQEGALNAGDSHVLTTEPNTMIIGYTTLTYTQFSGGIDYVGGTNIDVIGQTISLTGTVAATNGGTGTNTVTTGDLLYGSASNVWSKLPLGVAYKSLIVNASGTQLEWNATPLNQPTAVSGQLGFGNGGTGQSTQQAAINALAGATTSAQYLRGNGTNVVMSAIQAADVPTLNQNTSGSAGSVVNSLTAGTGITFSSGTTYNGSAAITINTTSYTPTIDRLTSTQQSTATALADVTQLVRALAANATYSINCFVTFQSAATTTGLNLGFTSPTGCVCSVEVVVPVTSTAAASQLRTTFPNAAATNTGNVLGTGVTAINSNHTARISGIITNGANAGNFQVRFATEVNASAITLQTSSVMVLERLV